MTDANLVLGRLNPGHFLGGEMKLDVAAARAAVERIAAPLGYSGERGLIQMADGIIALATVIMAGRDQADLGRARPRPARVRAVQLRRRRAAARERAGA